MDLSEYGERAGIDVGIQPHPFDHGAWAPLRLMAPRGTVPVVPLSVSERPFDDCIAWGRAIAGFAAGRADRLVLVASGALTHRLDRFFGGLTAPYPPGVEFDKRVIDLTLAGDAAGLNAIDPKSYERAAPEGGLRHLWILMGALADRHKEILAYELRKGSVGEAVIAFR